MKIPVATYRVQFNRQFPFSAAGEIVDYLADLGISDIYASPIFKAKKESLHGYDVVDPLQINPELGGMEAFQDLARHVQARGLGWLQDIVPNHMAYDSENKLLMDVLENGPFSPYLSFFDVHFDHPYENLRNKILAPFLGELYGRCLEKQEIQLRFRDGAFFIQYYDWLFPVRIDSYLPLLTQALPRLVEQLGHGSETLLRFMEVTEFLKKFSSVQDPSERMRQIVLIKSLLWKLYSSQDAIRGHIDHILNRTNNKMPDAPAMAELDRLLSEQFFRLAFWKVGNDELNYRRFFTINGLVCLRVELDTVFDHVHRLILHLVDEGIFTGLRVDHLDGLYEPAVYLKKLKQRTGGVYTVVEKILDLHEELPPHFSTEGTTGYDFLNFVNGVLVDNKNEKKIEKTFAVFTQAEIDYQTLVAEKKQLFIGRYMAGDIDNLAQLFKRLLNRNPHGRDLTMYGLKRALVEVMAQFPVYRTYVDAETVRDADKIYIREAMARARNRNPGVTYELDAIEKILLLHFDPDMSFQEKGEWLQCVKRFQQFTGPLMAKGAEDTTFYIYNRLISLNEVGGNPGVFGISEQEFHEFQLRRKERWPHAMSATATHDTKRGEDVRCRVNVLSEMPQAWTKMLNSWQRMNRAAKNTVNGLPAPDKDDEYFIYQTLLGAFPFKDSEIDNFRKRMEEYIVKAIREAKIHTAWVKPDTDYEESCVRFIRRLLSVEDKNEFLESFIPFQKKIAQYGMLNSLSQTLLKLTAPGVPDLYQGTELWDLSLVDPDNRRSVDYQIRKQWLAKIRSGEHNLFRLIEELWQNRDDGRIKMFLIQRVLAVRNRLKEIFQNGNYLPLEIHGEFRHHLLAFARHNHQACLITVVPRLWTRLIKEEDIPMKKFSWKRTSITLPQAWAGFSWQDVITGTCFSAAQSIPVRMALNQFPVALLASGEKVSYQRGS